ncbi:MAG: PLP-dependent aminotransferase family protein [Pseudomonadota bacterium]
MSDLDPQLIDLAIGQPAPDLLPVHFFERVTQAFTQRLDPELLNYGDYAGDPRFLEALARFLTAHYGFAVHPGSLFLCAGASHGIDLACRLCCERGDVVLVEEPTYFLALEIFASLGLQVVSVAMDDEGLVPEALQQALAQHPRAKVLYTIPVHHNPTSITLSGERREQILALTRARGVTVLADEVYQLLHFGQSPPLPAPFAAHVQGGGVVSVGSFSKILAPAMRVGWLQTDPDTRAQLCQQGVIRSGGAINQVGSLFVRGAIESGLLDEHLRERLVPVLRTRAATMAQGLARWAEALGVRWRPAQGGYFFWLELPARVDTAALLARARPAGVGFHPGVRFSASDEQRRTLRLSFARFNEPQIEVAMERLGQVIESQAH